MSLFTKRNFISLIPIVLLQSSLVSAFAQCYYPDGSIPNDYLWEPCVGTTGAKYSSCCVPSEGDICQDNGLCYFPSSYDTFGDLYRGACTDRTWNDPACNANICVSGFETTWMWVAKCDNGGTESNVCGTLPDGIHSKSNCTAGATTKTASVRTSRTTTSAGRYTAPPSLDPSVYSVFTSTYTTAITAKEQRTTVLSTFQSTFTSTIGKAAASGTPSGTASATGTSANSGSATTGGVDENTETTKKKKHSVTISTGVLVAIVAGPVLAIGISIAIFLLLRKKRAAQKGESIRLNSAGGPPPNGPVGADQIHPYEVDVNESSQRPVYGYKAPKVESHEIDDRAATMRSDKLRNEHFVAEKYSSPVTELGVQGHETVMTPSPAYVENTMPYAYEMDGTSSPHVGGRR